MRKDHDQYHHTSGPEEHHATTTSTAHNFRVSLQQKMGKTTGVVSTSIQFEDTSSSERIEEILRLDWKNKNFIKYFSRPSRVGSSFS